MPHYHIWIRSGRVFTMKTRAYANRHTAKAAARKLKPNVADRLVLACEDCPPTARSKRPRASRAADAKFLAQRLGVEPQRVRSALEELAAARRGGAAAPPADAPILPLDADPPGGG